MGFCLIFVRLLLKHLHLLCTQFCVHHWKKSYLVQNEQTVSWLDASFLSEIHSQITSVTCFSLFLQFFVRLGNWAIISQLTHFF